MATRTEAGEAAEGRKLHREVNRIGLLFVSLGSIIGSGWLFGALTSAQIAGPAAIISWVLGAIVMLVLALAHAELGSMYPVAGGSTRYPHFAFGSLAGYSHRVGCVDRGRHGCAHRGPGRVAVPDPLLPMAHHHDGGRDRS